MAKVWIERAYIEPHDENVDNFSIEISTTDGILLGKVNLDNPKEWLYTMTNEDGDLVINNSAGMEAKKWDHLTKEIIEGDKPDA
jgi:hypothetical protein